MSEKLPEPYGWLYYGSPDGPLFRRDHPEGLYWLCVSSAPVYSHEQMRVAVAEAAALRRERDELAARLAEIEQAEPVAWIEHELQGTGLRHLHFERRPNALRDDVIAPVWTALIPRPAPSAAPDLADIVAAERERWKRIAENAQAVTTGGDDKGDYFEVPSHLIAALALALDEGPGAQCQVGAPAAAPDLDADIIEAQRAVVQQLASRPTCDWPGKCAHKRPAPAAAPEQVKPRFAPCGRSAGTCGRSTHGCGRQGCQADTSEPTDAELVAAEWPDGFEQAVQRLPTLADAVALFDGPAQAKPCRCRRCLTERGDLLTLASTMIVCPTCGNKRCPHATDHRHACTGSNEPGQPGSYYGDMQDEPATAAAPERAEPEDPRTPPPGCRLLGDYEPAQAGDMAYIGAIAGRWRRVKPRMGIIGATMDELSDGARVLALARPCPLPQVPKKEKHE